MNKKASKPDLRMVVNNPDEPAAEHTAAALPDFSSIRPSARSLTENSAALARCFRPLSLRSNPFIHAIVS